MFWRRAISKVAAATAVCSKKTPRSVFSMLQLLHWQVRPSGNLWPGALGLSLHLPAGTQTAPHQKQLGWQHEFWPDLNPGTFWSVGSATRRSLRNTSNCHLALECLRLVKLSPSTGSESGNAH